MRTNPKMAERRSHLPRLAHASLQPILCHQSRTICKDVAEISRPIVCSNVRYLETSSFILFSFGDAAALTSTFLVIIICILYICIFSVKFVYFAQGSTLAKSLAAHNCESPVPRPWMIQLIIFAVSSLCVNSLCSA